MPNLTINGERYDFEKGETILQVALRNGVEIPHYCYHPELSIVANCRICLAEVWAPNPRTGVLEPGPKLFPTCQHPAADGQVVHTDSPKAMANQKAVMEYLLINHPVDCPVCDQAGECHLQDYSYQYGRGQSRFLEDKEKKPKKDLGPHVLLYSDRCIMCTRCVRFTREVTGTGELMVDGRGNHEEIDVFPGIALDNELSGNVVDICPVGALLDKDFLFQQRVWFLKKTPSIDGITSSGDNISVEHNEGRIHRIKPRTNPEVNRWWITDEVRYGWKFVHREDRLRLPTIAGRDPWALEAANEAWTTALDRANELLEASVDAGRRAALLVSPMLSCEDSFWLSRWVRSVDSKAITGVGPIPRHGEDRKFPGGFTVRAEKAPNARGVRRVLESGGAGVLDFKAFVEALRKGSIGVAVVTGNYPSEWITPELMDALGETPTVLIDTLPSALGSRSQVVLPGAAWVEKEGSFENVGGRLQAFERAIAPPDFARAEAQIALDLIAQLDGAMPPVFSAADTRREMFASGLGGFDSVHEPPAPGSQEPDMIYLEL
ncbi:MAG: 2Fe-2S iron-sulfur cluster binding domain-containing protein [Phycisphaerae bacterium]|nr:2Fe-2S iron-sulfur cluster binding domain-containing protein [Phycisphaerae bacterium]